MIDLSLTGAGLGGEPWRLWTGHLVHWGMEHLALNVVAMLPPLFLLRRREAARIALWLFAAAPLVSVPILLSGVATYRGASGLVVGFWCAAALALWRRGDAVPALALLALVATKVSLEASGVAVFPHEGYYVVPLAHQAGALLGLAIEVAWFAGTQRGAAVSAASWGAAVSPAVGAASRGAHPGRRRDAAPAAQQSTAPGEAR